MQGAAASWPPAGKQPQSQAQQQQQPPPQQPAPPAAQVAQQRHASNLARLSPGPAQPPPPAHRDPGQQLAPQRQESSQASSRPSQGFSWQPFGASGGASDWNFGAVVAGEARLAGSPHVAAAWTCWLHGMHAARAPPDLTGPWQLWAFGAGGLCTVSSCCGPCAEAKLCMQDCPEWAQTAP